MFRRTLTTAAAITIATFCATNYSSAEEKILNIGDAAPALAVNWVKGDKVEKFEPSKIYVIEFWATWCGACIKNMPHLTELAHKYKDQGVQIIGVDIFEEDPERAKPFIEAMGDKMDYSVALDKIPEGKSGSSGLMATTWMRAAQELAMPTAFIVRDGKIQWIGTPTASFDDILAQVVAGQWNGAALAQERLAHKSGDRFNVLRMQLIDLQNANDFKGMVSAIDAAASVDEHAGKYFAPWKFAALCHASEIEQAIAFSEKVKQEYWNGEVALGTFATMSMHPPTGQKVDPRIAKLALEFAARAVELNHEKNIPLLNTLAEVQSFNGDPASAAATTEKAIKALADAVGLDSPAGKENLKILQERLEKFRAAAAGQQGKK